MVHPALRPYVDHIVHYRDRPPPEAAHVGLPSASGTVIVALDEPLDAGWLATPDRHERTWMSASGLHVGPALIRTHGYQHGVQIQLTPRGARAFFDVPIGALSAQIVSMDDLESGFCAADYDRVASAGSDRAKVAALEGILLSRVARFDGAEMDADLTHAWELFVESRGTLPVGVVADRVGWSRRHLVSRFGAEFGVTPKQAARLLRFQHAGSLLDQGHRLADTAARAGFADQAHLTREWTAMAGQPPTRARRSPYPNLQDLIGAPTRT